MKDICPDRGNSPRSAHKPQPVNLHGDRPPDDSGFVIVLFRAGALPPGNRELVAAANEAGRLALVEMLEDLDLPSSPLITSVGVEELERLERVASESELPPLHSLSNYWRLDAREATQPLQEIESALRRLDDVELVYREKRATAPVNPTDDTYSGWEHFLDAAPDGIDARWVWTQPNGNGAGMHFIDLEQGWLLGHEDLPGPTLIFNENCDGTGYCYGDHGAAVLGVVAGVDNDKGIIGIAPGVASVRTVSSFNTSLPTAASVADALIAAVTAKPQPHLVLIEAQVGVAELPVETEVANFDAIRTAVANGVIVVEAGGNGNNDLDAWTDASGKHFLNRNSLEYLDSGAILVGAGTSVLPHNRSVWKYGEASNYGSRVDCYSWGDGIMTCGYGDVSGLGNGSYTRVFGGTSGASAIIAGAALLLQAMSFATAQKTLFSPQQMRALLSAPANGTTQGGGVNGNIGVMPDLRRIVNSTQGLVP